MEAVRAQMARNSTLMENVVWNRFATVTPADLMQAASEGKSRSQVEGRVTAAQFGALLDLCCPAVFPARVQELLLLSAMDVCDMYSPKPSVPPGTAPVLHSRKGFVRWASLWGIVPPYRTARLRSKVRHTSHTSHAPAGAYAGGGAGLQ